MARARNIKPGFFRNADLVELPVETRLLFIGLWTLADREGRLEDRPKQIKMEIFPADSFDVGSMLDQLQSAGFVDRYEVDSIKVLEVLNFIKHQDPHYKEKASELPPRAGAENFMRATGVTRLQRQRILERDEHQCQHCTATDALCVDHVLPISRGGDSSDGNLQILCSACNTKKGNKLDGETKNSKQRRIDVGSNLNQRNDASPSEPGFLTPESPTLIPDSPSNEGVERTPEAQACLAMKAAGMQSVNPSSPKLTALLKAGITVAELASAAAEAVGKGKPFAYALAAAEGQRRDAATAPLPAQMAARNQNKHAGAAAAIWGSPAPQNQSEVIDV